MTARKIIIPYRPRPLQAEIHRLQQQTRFSVLICHRRFGKTVHSVNRLIRSAIDSPRPDFRGGYVAPLYKQAKTIAWDYLKYYGNRIRDVEFNEAELRLDFARQKDGRSKRIQLYGANNPDSLRGIYLDAVIFDEVAQMPFSMWTKIVRPALADRKGWASFIGTPQGKNALWELWKRAQTDPSWMAAMYRASETGILDDDELEAARREMPPEEFEQEFECSFTAAIRGAYFGGLMADADRDKRVTDVPYDPALPVHTAWDLGVSDSTTIWFVQAHPGGKFAVIDYYEASGAGLDHYAEVLRKRGYAYGRHIAPHDIRVRELGTGKSRLETARNLGIRFDICPNIPVQDGINAIRTILPRCWFDETRCEDGIEALRHYRREFNDKTGDFKQRPRHDWASHATDAFRYFAVGFRQERSGPRQAKALNNFNPFRRADDGRQERSECTLWR